MNPSILSLTKMVIHSVKCDHKKSSILSVRHNKPSIYHKLSILPFIRNSSQEGICYISLESQEFICLVTDTTIRYHLVY